MWHSRRALVTALMLAAGVSLGCQKSEPDYGKPNEIVFIETEFTSRQAARAIWKSMYEKYGLPSIVWLSEGKAYQETYWYEPTKVREELDPGDKTITKAIYDDLFDSLPVGAALYVNWPAVGAPLDPRVVLLSIQHNNDRTINDGRDTWDVSVREMYEVLPDGTKIPVTKYTWERHPVRRSFKAEPATTDPAPTEKPRPRPKWQATLISSGVGKTDVLGELNHYLRPDVQGTPCKATTAVLDVRIEGDVAVGNWPEPKQGKKVSTQPYSLNKIAHDLPTGTGLYVEWCAYSGRTYQDLQIMHIASETWASEVRHLHLNGTE